MSVLYLPISEDFLGSVNYLRRRVVYVTDVRSPGEPEVAILDDGHLYIGMQKVKDPLHHRSTLRAAGVSRGLNGEDIRRFVEIGPQVTLRLITAAGDSWWDVYDAGGES